jgi:hypothetical protein
MEITRLSAMKEHNSVVDSMKKPVQQLPSLNNENGAPTNRQRLFRWLKQNGYSCIQFNAKLEEDEGIQNEKVSMDDISSFTLPHYPNIIVSLVKENVHSGTLGSAGNIG